MRKFRTPTFSWHMLPIFLVITTIIGIVVTYIIAKRRCHVEKWILPYISYTGTEQPESGIFGLILNVEGFLGGMIVVIAWRYLRHVQQGTALNNVALLCGIVSCFGVIMVGNFQVSKNKIPHYIGAGLAFIIGTLYSTLASINIYRLYHSFKNFTTGARIVIVCRFMASAVMICSILILTAVAVLRLRYNEKYKNTFVKLDKYNFTYPNGTCIPIRDLVPLYKQNLDLVGSCVEWLLMICLLLCLSLYTYEFKNFEDIKIVLKNQNQPLSISCVRLNVECAFTHDGASSATSPTSSLLQSHSDTTGVLSQEDINLSNTHRVVTNPIQDNNNGRVVFDKAYVELSCNKEISQSLPNLSKGNIEI